MFPMQRRPGFRRQALIGALLCAFCVTCSAGVASAQAGSVTVSLRPGNVGPVNVGDTFTLDLYISSGAQPLDGIGAVIQFPAQHLAVVDASGNPAAQITPDPTTFETVLQNTANNTTGQINYDAGALQGAPPTGEFRVASTRFKVVSAVPATGVSVTLSGTMTSLAGNALTTVLQPATVTGHENGDPALAQATRMNIAPTINGDLAEWSGVPVTSMDDASAATHGGPQPHPGPADLTVALQAGWDSGHLYYAATITDDALVGNDSSNIWEDDALELGIQIGGHTRQFTLAVDGRTSELIDGWDRTTPDIVYQVRQVSGGWRLEASISASALGMNALNEGSRFPFTMGYWDDDDGGSGDSHLILWGNSTNSDPGQWGTLILAPDTISQCFALGRNHTGLGGDPIANPTNSAGCATGQYIAGTSINLTASPASGWRVSSWSGTNNDSSTSITNSLTMPAGNRTVAVNYAAMTRRDQVEAFVTRFYQQCLNREPDAAGLDGYTNALLDGTLTGAEVAQSFVLSPEFLRRNTSDEDFLRILYRAFFNREPDAAGFSGWLDFMRNGMSRTRVLREFTHSQEFIRLCSNYDISPFRNLTPVEAFVTRFYQECLDREPDPTGLTGYTQYLLNGTLSGAQVAESFVLSPEFMARQTSDEQFLQIMYRAFFNREPDPTGYNGWLGYLRSGWTRAQVLYQFTHSQEFSALCAQYQIRPY